MAINYNINPYGGGNVVFDQRPYIAFYERQMTKEQAKNDALENYFKDLNKNITSAGMRSQDVPGLLQMNKAWQDHYIQNKDAILHPQKDGGRALNEYNAGYQNQLALSNESKQAQKKTEKLGELKFNKDASYIFDDPDIVDNIKLHDLPIGDPRRKDFDIATAMLPPRPIGMKEREDFSKYITGGAKQDEIRGAAINMGNYQTQTPITSQYSDQTKKTFGDKAADVYDTDRSWRLDAVKFYKEQVIPDPILHKQLDDIFKRHYGREVDTPRDAFIAKTILDHDIRNIKYEKGEDEYGRQRALKAIQFGYDKQLKNKDEKPAEDSWVTPHLETLKEAAYKTTPLPYKYANGKVSMEYDIPIDPVLGQALSVSGVQPDAFRVDKNGNFRRIFYKRYEKGDKLPNGKDAPEGEPKINKENKVTVDEVLSRPQLSQQQIELALGKKALTGKELNEQMIKTTKGAATAIPKGKKYSDGTNTYTYEELLKHYPADKIKQYIDAGILK